MLVLCMSLARARNYLSASLSLFLPLCLCLSQEYVNVEKISPCALLCTTFVDFRAILTTSKSQKSIGSLV